MAPFQMSIVVTRSANVTDVPTRGSLSLNGDILEAWAEGFHVGALIILILIVFCNIRRGVWLHKLILLELILAIWHGTFIFCQDPVYGWYLSATATLLFTSYQLHNIISWIKIKRFLPRWGSLFFIGTIIAVQPFWAVEAWSNYEYFNGLGSNANIYTRPWEALFRDPWWIFTTCRLVYAIKRNYNYPLLSLIRDSPRFGIMILCMLLSIVFLLTDVVLALVFKCASDTIFLDDFKSVLDTVVENALRKAGGAVSSGQRRPSAGHSDSHKMADRPKLESKSASKSSATDVSPLKGLNSITTCTVAGQTTASRVRWDQKLFLGRDDSAAPKMEIRRNITISTSHEERARNNSLEIFDSKERFLTKPELVYVGKDVATRSLGPEPDAVDRIESIP
ncbi:hypothetical protein MMC17_000072 [Xylographa soralifera]|nr:hypothetical protein [Xylographa soralifera]